jgi:hypothetical protein
MCIKRRKNTIFPLDLLPALGFGKKSHTLQCQVMRYAVPQENVFQLPHLLRWLIIDGNFE